jgi:hypothetical protein
MRELQIHDGFIKWLKKNRLAYIRARADKKSGIRTGWPDFTILHCNRSLLIEVKTARGALSRAQKIVIAELRAQSGIVVQVARSVEECCAITISWLGIVADEKVLYGEPGGAAPVGIISTTGAKVAPVPVGERLQNIPFPPGSKVRLIQPGETVRIGNWQGTPWLIVKKDGKEQMVRKATDADIAAYG